MNFADRLHNLGDGWSDAERRVAGCDRGPRNDVYGWPRRRLGRRDECRNFCEFQILSSCFFFETPNYRCIPLKGLWHFRPDLCSRSTWFPHCPCCWVCRFRSPIWALSSSRSSPTSWGTMQLRSTMSRSRGGIFQTSFFYQFIVFQIRRDLCICLLVHRTA